MPFVSLDDMLNDLADLKFRMQQQEEKVKRLEHFELERQKAAGIPELPPIPRRRKVD